ncbi:hypothetical protein [Streptomyces sp. NPDC088910]|uniref:hypothetical protein n=1 Tax=Streptomyces sp. NPDC088910 TaxID=3365911 RepID=UPI00381FB188
MKHMQRATALAVAVGSAAVLALAAVPSADAATAVNCSGGSVRAAGNPNNITSPLTTTTTACPGWADSGPTYVFHLAKFVEEVLISGRWVPFNASNVVATCSLAAVSGTTITAGGCAYAAG